MAIHQLPNRPSISILSASRSQRHKGPWLWTSARFFIVSKKAAQNATTDDFNSGKALVGTEPFKFPSFKRGDRIELLRNDVNDVYWGEKSPLDKVTFRILTSDGARLAALLAGEVDAIENVPPADVAKLKTNPQFKLAQKISWCTIFWTLDQARDKSPDITDNNGKPARQKFAKRHPSAASDSNAINRPIS